MGIDFWLDLWYAFISKKNSLNLRSKSFQEDEP